MGKLQPKSGQQIDQVIVNVPAVSAASQHAQLARTSVVNPNGAAQDRLLAAMDAAKTAQEGASSIQIARPMGVQDSTQQDRQHFITDAFVRTDATSPPAVDDTKIGLMGTATVPVSVLMTAAKLASTLFPLPETRLKPGLLVMYVNLTQLGLDQDSLKRKGVPSHVVARLYHLLHSHSLAFSTWLTSEQRRLALLLQSKDGVPLADRLVAFLTGDQEGAVWEPPTLEEALAQRPADERGEGFQGGSGVLNIRPAHLTTPEAWVDKDVGLRPAEDTMDMQEVEAMTNTGNTVGLKRLLRRYYAMHLAVREHMEGRLQHETSRAQRIQDKLKECQDQLHTCHQEAEAFRRTVSACEEHSRHMNQVLASEKELVFAERAVNEALRDEITQLEAQWSAQQAEAVLRVTERLEALQAQSDGQLDLRDQYLERTRELVVLQLQYDHELRKVTRLSAELNASRTSGDVLNSELQTLSHWKSRLEARADASEGLAAAQCASALLLQNQLDKEKAAHARTHEHSQHLRCQIEAARVAATDLYARASHQVRDQAATIATQSARIRSLERQLQECKDVLKIRQFETDNARAASKAAAQQVQQLMVEGKTEMEARIAAEQLSARLQQQIDDLYNVKNALEEEIAEFKRELDTAQHQVKAKDRMLEDMRQFSADLELYREKMSNLERCHTELRAAHEALQAVERQQIGRIAEHEERLEKQSKELEAVNEHVAELTSQVVQFERVNAELLLTRDEALQLAQRLSGELATCSAQLSATQTHLTESKSELEKAVAALATFRDEAAVWKREAGMFKGRLTAEQDKVEKLELDVSTLLPLRDTVTSLKRELKSTQERLRVAEAAQVSALADQAWWRQAKQQLEGALQEANARSSREAEELQALSARVQSGLTQVQGEMLSLPPPMTTPPGLCAEDSLAMSLVATAVEAALSPEVRVLGQGRGTSIAGIALHPVNSAAAAGQDEKEDNDEEGGDKTTGNLALPFQDAHAARQLASDLQLLTERLQQSAAHQAQVTSDLIAHVKDVESHKSDEVQTNREAFKQAMDVAMQCPKATPAPVVIPTTTTTATCTHVDRSPTQAESTRTSQARAGALSVSPSGSEPLDPNTARIVQLQHLVPASVVEQQTKQLSALRIELGDVKGALATAQSMLAATEATLAHERESADARQDHWTSLVEQLQAQVAALTRHVAAAQGGRIMAERTALSLCHQLAEADYKVSKAEERETLLSKPGLVPQSRVDRGVQTVYAEIWNVSPPTTPAELARRAPAVQGVPTWGANLGCGSVAMPSLGTSAHKHSTRQRASGTAQCAASPIESREWAVSQDGYVAVEDGTVLAYTSPLALHLASLASAVAGIHDGSSRPASPNKMSGMFSRPSSAVPLVLGPRGAALPSHSPRAPPTPNTTSPPSTPTSRQARPARLSSACQRPPAQITSSEAMRRRLGLTAPVAQPQDVWAGEGLQEWQWTVEAAPLLSEAHVLCLQETLDLIADVYRSKAASDAAAQEGGWLPTTLPQFLGGYVNCVYSPQFGPRPTSVMASIMASVMTHAVGVYEVRTFGRQAGILASPAKDSAPSRPLTHGTSQHAPGAVATSGSTQARLIKAGMKEEPAALSTTTEAAGTIKASTQQVKAGQGASATKPVRTGGLRPSTAFPSHAHYLAQQEQQQIKSFAPPSADKLSRKQRLHQAAAQGLALLPIQPQGIKLEHGLLSSMPPQAASTASPRPSTAVTLARSHSAPLRPATAHLSTGLSGSLMQAGAGAWPLADSVTHGTELDACMAAVLDLPGADEAVRFVASGAPLDYIQLGDLGTPVLETMAPELHLLVAQVSGHLGLEVAPHIFVNPSCINDIACKPHLGSWPLGMPSLMLHVPHISDAALIQSPGNLARQMHRLPDGSFGWRRRAVLLVMPQLTDLFKVQPADVQAAPAFTLPEAKALIAMTLAPMCLPGGGGWRLNLHTGGLSVPTGNTGVGPRGSLAPADVITTANLAHLLPEVLLPRLPVQLRVKWPTIHAAVLKAALGCTAVGDRLALMCTDLGTVATAIFKAVHLHHTRHQPDQACENCPSGEQLVNEALKCHPLPSPPTAHGEAVQLPSVNMQLGAVLAYDLTDALAGAGEHQTRSWAMLRIAHLAHWSKTQPDVGK